MNTKYLGSLAALVLASTSILAGCEVDAAIGPDADIGVAPQGSLTIGWTVEGRDDAHACSDVKASRVEIDVYDSFGDYVASTRADCADFGVTIDLPDGEFNADATLVDDFDEPVSTTASLDRVEVDGDEDFDVDIDFPAASML